MYREVAIRAARAGGQALRKHFHQGTEVFAKGVDDIVTAADHASEVAILSHIRDTFPTHAIFSEEKGAKITPSDSLWIVDPLDGTHNFVLGLPYFSVSVALQRSGRTVLGVVYHPMLDELYVAEWGKGATVNGERMRITDLDDIRLATAYYDQGYGVEREAGLQLYIYIARATRRCLQLWSPALDWCNVARGRAHLIVANDAEIEDKLAGVLILQEAGGVVTDWAGRPPTFDILKQRTTHLIGSVPGLHRVALQLIRLSIH